MVDKKARETSPGDLRIAAIVVDHGSRRDRSNRLLEQLAREFEQRGSCPIVEPAHMDIASPDIAAAFDACVRRGATFIVVHPFFLLPGRHLEEDIPDLVAAASARHPSIGYVISKPVGLHPLIHQIIEDSITEALESQGQ